MSMCYFRRNLEFRLQCITEITLGGMLNLYNWSHYAQNNPFLTLGANILSKIHLKYSVWSVWWSLDKYTMWSIEPEIYLAKLWPIHREFCSVRKFRKAFPECACTLWYWKMISARSGAGMASSNPGSRYRSSKYAWLFGWPWNTYGPTKWSPNNPRQTFKLNHV